MTNDRMPFFLKGLRYQYTVHVNSVNGFGWTCFSKEFKQTCKWNFVRDFGLCFCRRFLNQSVVWSKNLYTLPTVWNALETTHPWSYGRTYQAAWSGHFAKQRQDVDKAPSPLKQCVFLWNRLPLMLTMNAVPRWMSW
jgi:hypothetical protein